MGIVSLASMHLFLDQFLAKKHIAHLFEEAHWEETSEEAHGEEILQKQFKKKDLQKGVFRQRLHRVAAAMTWDEKDGQWRSAQPWLGHLAPPSFIFSPIATKTKADGSALACIMVDGPISGAERRNKSGTGVVQLLSPNIPGKESASLNWVETTGPFIGGYDNCWVKLLHRNFFLLRWFEGRGWWGSHWLFHGTE